MNCKFCSYEELCKKDFDYVDNVTLAIVFNINMWMMIGHLCYLNYFVVILTQ